MHITNSDHGAASGRNDGWAGAFAVILIKVIDAASIPSTGSGASRACGACRACAVRRSESSGGEAFAADPVAAGRWSCGQPDPGDAGEGGSSVGVLPADPGMISRPQPWRAMLPRMALMCSAPGTGTCAALAHGASGEFFASREEYL
jgi:hypothetical protein